MRFAIGVMSAVLGWVMWLLLGGATGFVVGAASLAAAHFIGTSAWQKLRNREAASKDQAQSPYLLGWAVTAALLLVLASVVILMGHQIEHEHALAAQQSVSVAIMQDYPGKSVLEFGVLLGAAGLATLVAGVVRWVEHRRFAQAEGGLAKTS